MMKGIREVEIKDKLLLTLKEASELSNIDAMVLREACGRGRINYTVTTRQQKIFVSRQSLEDYVEELCRVHEPIDVAAARNSHKERLHNKAAGVRFQGSGLRVEGQGLRSKVKGFR